MIPITQPVVINIDKYTEQDAMDILFEKLGEAMDDMENGRVSTFEDAWKEIDSI